LAFILISNLELSLCKVDELQIKVLTALPLQCTTVLCREVFQWCLQVENQEKFFLDADMTSTEMIATSDQTPVEGSKTTQEKMVGMMQDSKENKVKNETNKTVPFYKLFSFADSQDCLLMLVGAISAVANGICTPLLTIFVGDAIDALGGHADNKQVLHEVSKVIRRSSSLIIINAVKYLLERNYENRVRGNDLKNLLEKTTGNYIDCGHLILNESSFKGNFGLEILLSFMS